MNTSPRYLFRWMGAALLAAAVLGCDESESESKGGGTGPEGSFSISAVPSLTVEAGSSGTVQVGITRSGGFADAVILTLEDHPAELTHDTQAAYVTTSTVTLAFTVAATVAPGTYAIKACGASTGLPTQCTTISLTVTAPPVEAFTLALLPVSLNIPWTGTGATTVTISRNAPFAGQVTLEILGLPPGVTGSFNPAQVGPGVTSSTLTIKVACLDVSKTYYPVVRGSAEGVAAQERTLNLIVAWWPGDLVVTAIPQVLSLEQTSSGEVDITIERTCFDGDVLLRLENVPPGLSYSFVPEPIPAGTTTAKLTLTPALTMAPGVYPLTVRGMYGWAMRSTVVTLTVVPKS
jgi:hypothetical protein